MPEITNKPKVCLNKETESFLTFDELMEYSKEIRRLYSIPPLPIKTRNMKHTLGRAWWNSTNPSRNRISLANKIFDNRYLAISVLIHEYCHIIVADGHTEEFFRVNDVLHTHFGLKEIRGTKTYHGDIYHKGELVYKGYVGKRQTRVSHVNKVNQIDYAELL